MKNLRFFLLAIIFLACSSEMKKSESEPAKPDMSGETEKNKDVAMTDSEPKPNQSVQTIERKLIRNGNISFKAKDVKATKTEIDKICKELNGYVSNENQNNYYDRLSFSQKIRVPAARFDELVQRIDQLAERVDNKTISTDDVTEEFIDTESRLKAKRELEKEYTSLFSRAQKMDDLLAIERERGNVRAEIESMQGRLNYLQNQVSFSTLDINYYEEVAVDFGWGSELVRALRTGWQNLLSFLTDLLSIWPFVLMITAFTWWFIRYRRRKKAAQQNQ